MKKYLFGTFIILTLGFIFGISYVNAGSYFNPPTLNVNSSTCANCAFTNVNNNFSAGQTVNGNVTSTGITVTSATSTSYIANSNGIFSFPSPIQLAAGANCGSTSGVTEVGNCMNDIYTYGAGLGYGAVQINIGPFIYVSSTYTNPILCTTNTVRCFLNGVPGETNLLYGGAPGTIAITLNTDNIGSPQLTGSQLYGITLYNQTGDNGTSTNPTDGVFMGGTNGGEHILIDRSTIAGFGRDIEYGSNTYDTEVEDTVLRTSNYASSTAAYWDTPNNSGESQRWDNVFVTGTGNNCLYFSQNSVATFSWIGGSKDNCGVYVSSGNLSLTFNVHDENASYGTVGAYYRYVIATSTGSVVNVSGLIMNDAGAASTSAAFFLNSATLDISGLSVDLNGSASATTNLVNESASGTVNIQSWYPIQSPVLGLVNGSNINALTYQQQGTNLPIVEMQGQLGIGTSSPQAPLDVMDLHGNNVGGIDAIIEDGSSTVSTPVIISHKAGGSGNFGADELIGINAYINAAGSAAVVNTSTAGWEFSVDARNNASPSLQIISVSTSSVSKTIATISTTGLVTFNQSTTINGVLGFSGATTTVSSCGGGTPSVTGYDNGGTVTIGTGGITACTVNFVSHWAVTPLDCVLTDSSSTDDNSITSLTTSSLVVAFPLTLNAGTFYYHCDGNPD